jgi:hypothetical protein
MSGPNWRCVGPWPLCGHPRNTCTASPAYQAAIKVKHASSMTTPDIAGLCERLRKRATASFEANKNFGRKGKEWAIDTEVEWQAADTLERQAAEIERLRKAAKAFEFAVTTDIPVGSGYAEWVARAQQARADLQAALTGEES